MTDSPSPARILASVATGAVAGAVGTVAMDLLWWRRSLQAGATDSFEEFEVVDADRVDTAGAPAQVVDRAIRAVGGRLDDEDASTAANAAHWTTGAGWGALYGASVAARGGRGLLDGPILGAVAWSTAYGVLGPLGIYRPIWDYEASTLWRDLSAHLLFGTATAVAVRAVPLPRRRRG